MLQLRDTGDGRRISMYYADMYYTDILLAYTYIPNSAFQCVSYLFADYVDLSFYVLPYAGYPQ